MTQTQYQDEDSSWRSIAYPGWSKIFKSWSLNPYNGVGTIARRIFMWLILVLRTVVSLLSIFYLIFRNPLGSIIAGAILTVVNFACMIWSLSMIDRAQGRRKVFRKVGPMVVSLSPRRFGGVKKKKLNFRHASNL